MLIFCDPYVPNGHSKTPLDGSILQPFENVAGGLGLVGVIILLAFLFGVVWELSARLCPPLCPTDMWLFAVRSCCSS